MKAVPAEQVVKSACALCLMGCGILVHLRHGKVEGVTGDPESPLNKGRLCPKGSASLERLYHPDRLKYPRRRLGKRGEGKWQRISWDEALDTIGNELTKAKDKYGAESVAFIRGASKGFIDSALLRFANVFGTPNNGAAGYVCWIPRDLAAQITCGFATYGDVEYPPACIVLWGFNPFEVQHYEVETIRRAMEQGAKLVVIDPRNVGFAREADLWIQLRPGTDLALALGMMNVIINEGLFDRAFVANWTVGFDRLKTHVQDYPPKKVAEITWVSEEMIIQAARLYARSEPGCIEWGNALDHNLNSFQAARAIMMLRAITGNLSTPGGDVSWEPAPVLERTSPELTLVDKLPREKREKKIGADRVLPIFPYVPPHLITRAILEEDPYPIRVAYYQGNNPLLTDTNAEETYKALNKMDFVVVAEMFMTPTCELADIVLPVCSYLEYDNIVVPSSSPMALVQQKVAQIGECWPDYKIYNELAKRVGLVQYFWENVDSFLDEILKPSGLTFEEFRKVAVLPAVKRYREYKEEGFKTPSGKVELFSTQLQEWGRDPLPTYRELPATLYSEPGLDREYPLIFTSYKSAYSRHASDRNIPSLRAQHPEPVVEIHTETAKELGIEDGDWVYIETTQGRIKQKATLTTGVDPRVVTVDYGWWFPEKGASELYGWRESNVNVLTDRRLPFSPEVGSTNLRGISCKVYRSREEGMEI